MERRQFIRSGLIASILGFGGCQNAGSDRSSTATPDLNDPSERVRAFFTAEDWTDRRALVHNGSETYEYVEYRESETAAADRVQRLRTVETGRGTALVRIAYESGSCDRDCPTYVENVTVRRTEDGWRIYDAERVSGFPGSPTPVGTTTG